MNSSNRSYVQEGIEINRKEMIQAAKWAVGAIIVFSLMIYAWGQFYVKPHDKLLENSNPTKPHPAVVVYQ